MEQVIRSESRLSQLPEGLDIRGRITAPTFGKRLPLQPGEAAPSTASTLVLTGPYPHRGSYCPHHGFVYTSILVLKAPDQTGLGSRGG